MFLQPIEIHSPAHPQRRRGGRLSLQRRLPIQPRGEETGQNLIGPSKAVWVGRAFLDNRQVLSKAPERHIRDPQLLNSVLCAFSRRQPVPIEIPKHIRELDFPLRGPLILGAALVPGW